jgi:DNA replication regulator DPB11
MGATHQLDLTSDVTHLIVGSLDTPKYKYVARERPDVRPITQEFIAAVRSAWLEGDSAPINIAALEQQFRVPTLWDLKICVTGFEDIQFRKEIETVVEANGATYSGDLTRECTHLVAAKLAGAKYQYARTWGLKVVGIEWLKMSLDRGMVLEEGLFDPTLEPAERGKGAYVKKVEQEQKVGEKRKSDGAGAVSRARKLRRTASQKFVGQEDELWVDIVGGGSVVETKAKDSAQWDEQQEPVEATRAAKSELAMEDSTQKSRESDGVLHRTNGGTIRKSSPRRGLFHGRRFYLHGFDAKKTAVLEQHLHSHEAEILSRLDELPEHDQSIHVYSAFMLVPHSSSSNDIPSTPESTTVVTDMWVEQCLHRKVFVQPEANVTNSPFKHPITGFESLSICSTAFEGVDLLQLSKVVKLLGAKYDEFLTPQVSVLVSNNNTATRDKIRHALGWNIPIVSADWLWDSMRLGSLQPFGKHLVFSSQLYDLQERASADASVEQRANEKRTEQSRRRSSERTEARHETVQAAIEAETFQPPEASENPSTSNITQYGNSGITQEYSSVPTVLLAKVPDAHTTLGRTLSATDAPIHNPQPLSERSPNSSPPKALRSPPKPSIQSQAKPVQLQATEQAELAKEISSLLKYQQTRAASTSPRKPIAGAASADAPRRKKRLFGRAPSNLSMHSNLSRASSVGTENTDGLGTPLEGVFPLSNNGGHTLNSAGMKPLPKHASSTATTVAPPAIVLGEASSAAALHRSARDAITASLLTTHDEYSVAAHDLQAKEAAPPMTQLGYADEEEGRWRESLERKNSGLLSNEAPKKEERKKIGVVQDLAGVGRRNRGMEREKER